MEIRKGRNHFCSKCGKPKNTNDFTIEKRRGNDGKFYHIYRPECTECVGDRNRKLYGRKKRENSGDWKHQSVLHVESTAVWSEEELEMAQIARMTNDPGVYINYLHAKANKAL